MITHMAPAAQPLTVIHRADPAGQVTACCGLPMPPEDLWQPVVVQPDDTLCPGRAAQDTLL